MLLCRHLGCTHPDDETSRFRVGAWMLDQAGVVGDRDLRGSTPCLLEQLADRNAAVGRSLRTALLSGASTAEIWPLGY